MKKIFPLIALLALLIPLGLTVQAATTTDQVNISATVPISCGNGVVEGAEECDLGSGNGSCPSDCSATCTENSCGSIINPTTTPQSVAIIGVTAAEQCQTGSISWQTNLLPTNQPTQSNGYVEYWITNPAGNKTRINVTDNTTHSVNLSGLSPFTNYSYTIHAVAGAYTADYSGTFYTTCGLANPAFTVLAKNKGTELQLTYPNHSDIAGIVIYNGQTTCPAAASAEFYQSASSKAANSSEIIAGHSNTVLGQTYGYTACLYNSQNGYASGVYDDARRTISEAVSPSAVPGNKQVVLSWSNPAGNSANDFTFSKARLIRVNGACNASTGISGGTMLLENTGTGYTDSGLTNGQVYNYKLFVQNSYGEYSAGICLSATPSEVPVLQSRCPSGINKQLIENNAQFSWLNPQNEAGVFTLENIDWRRSATGCVQSKSDGSSVFSGTGQSFSDSGLQAGQSYYYTVFVTYSGNQMANCGCTVVTVAEEEILEENLCPECQVYEVSPRFSYLVNNGALEILPNNQSVLFSLPSQNINLRALASSLPKPAKQLVARFGGRDYLLALDGSGAYYQTLFDLPSQVGRYPLELITVYSDETYAKKQLTIEILPYGRVLSSLGRELPDTDVSLYLYRDGALFAGYGVSNPTKSGDRGAYGFMVPDGRYTLVAVKENYTESRQDIEVKNNVINKNITLAPDSFESIIGDIIDNPNVERVNRDVVLPTALAVAAVNLITSAPLWSFFYYLQLLFTEPFWFLFGRKRKGWGVVYNSITKLPVDLAVVRLYDANSKKLLQSRVTDKEGRYIFLVGEGQYYLEATNPKFEYPSKIMANVPEDSKFTDIYHGETITIKEGARGMIVANIPLDQKDVKVSNEQILKEVSRKKLTRGIALIGPILAVISLIILPGWLTGVLVVVHFGMYFMFRRLALKYRAKNWGVVYDIKGKKPLDKAIARIYSPEYGRMLDYYVTDKYGRYGFLAGHNTYYLTAEKPGFTPHKTENIDLKGKEGDKVVGLDIKLHPEDGAAIPPSSEPTPPSNMPPTPPLA